jgi:hypothetical protein
MKKMNKKRASQSARIQELEQHIVKIYMILEQVVNQLKDANTNTKEEREKE